ncbi:leucine-rich repeat neuronal protein 1 [Uranotaenia lowii]|uniref:leucine-rich repeat neuronal protein 1 n=1 Tax=Uranotaenia lowii TaxID=190385 RepID=UPI0024797662|nr:leucine-rich repeat neuronal protein 1 [Uranotaenia lowii]
MFGKLCLLIIILTASAAVVVPEVKAEAREIGAEDSVVVTKLCSFDKPLIDPTDESNSKFCDCDVENSPPWGIPVVLINCQDHHFQNAIFQVKILPQGTIRLDLSYNKLTSIPSFVSEKLQYLSVRHNEIASLTDKNFANVTMLLELDISENNIELINSDAFIGLTLLRKLNLAENKIKTIQPNAFSVFSYLEHLILSHNPLGEFLNSSENDIFLRLGVTPRLHNIELENCTITKIDLSSGVGLDNIVLGSNQLFQIPNLPKQLSLLDISDNPIRVMTAKFLPHLHNLQHLIMQDMPNLYKLEEFALFGLPRLTNLNLQGSRNLTVIDPYIFGKNVVLNETDTVLEHLNLKGTSIKTLNSSLEFAFERLAVLDLTGAPLNCDCQLQWIKHLGNATVHGSCTKPMSLRGHQLVDLEQDQFKCKVEKSWVYMMFNVLLVILLIVLVLAAIYLVYIAIRPRQKVQMRKPGSNSPYARVTIEPNQMENL